MDDVEKDEETEDRESPRNDHRRMYDSENPHARSEESSENLTVVNLQEGRAGRQHTMFQLAAEGVCPLGPVGDFAAEARLPQRRYSLLPFGRCQCFLLA